MSETIGSSIDNVINNVKNIPSDVGNFISGIRFRNPLTSWVYTGLSNYQKKIITSQNLLELKSLLAPLGKGAEWIDLDRALKDVVSGTPSRRIGGKLKSPLTIYLELMGEINLDLIDDLSASITREAKYDEDTGEINYNIKRSYYLNRKSQHDINLYLEAILAIKQRQDALCDLTKQRSTKVSIDAQFRASMSLLARAFKESGLYLNWTKDTLEAIPDETDIRHSTMAKHLGMAGSLMRSYERSVPPPLPTKVRP